MCLNYIQLPLVINRHILRSWWRDVQSPPKRIAFRFHETILRGSLGCCKFLIFHPRICFVSSWQSLTLLSHRPGTTSSTWRIIPGTVISSEQWWSQVLNRVVGSLPSGLKVFWEMGVTSYLLAGMALLSSLSLQVRIDGMPKGSLVDGPYIPICRDFAMYFSISNCTSEDRSTCSYCSWKKSCTSWYGPVNVPVFTGFTCLSWCRISSMNSSSSRFALRKGWKQVKIWCKSNLAPVDMFTHIIYIYYLIYISVFVCMFICIYI